MTKTVSKGSEWRIWDLHVHSPATYGGSYQEFITNAENSVASVIGINDYCTIKGYEEVSKLGGIPGKVIFPVVELRMHNLLQTRKNPNGVRINFHIIFDNYPASLSKIATWLSSLECFDEKGATVQLGTVSDLDKVSFDFEKVVSSLKKFDLYESHALVWLPYDEYGGADEIDPEHDGLFKISIINKAHIMGSSTKTQIDFFKWESEKFSDEEFAAWCEKPKPCIKGSDAHKVNYPFGQLQNAQSQPTDRYCWINADMTFNGLKQIVNEPTRVFIGDQPDLLKRVHNNKTKVIKSIEIEKLQGVNIDDVWFDNFNLELNSGLVAIIGNKGSGKSAITDVIGLCGNTSQNPSNFSFLTSNKFRKVKPYNLAEKFIAKMTWHDNTASTKKLNENPDRTTSERVKYIPQNFLENLCANVESDEFEKELKQIIFSHTPPDKRLGKSSLDELINYKSSLINDEIVYIHTEIAKLNLEIISLEAQNTEAFKRSVEDKIRIKTDELRAHDTILPQPPTSTTPSTDGEKVKELETLRQDIGTLEQQIEDLENEKSVQALQLEGLNRALQYYTNIDTQLASYGIETNEHVQTLTARGIDPKEVFTYKVEVKPISDKIADVEKSINEIDIALDGDLPDSKVHQLATLNEKLSQDQEALDKPARDHQRYLDNLKAWQLQKQEIEGDAKTDDTLQYYQAQLDYLATKLPADLDDKYEKRKGFLGELYNKKNDLIEVRKELFKPVTKFIADFKELQRLYDVKIDVSLELKTFPDAFFTLVNQQRKGTFMSKEEGYKKLAELTEHASFTSKEGFIDFTEVLLDNLKNDKRSNGEPVDINTQLRGGVELSRLYDFIFGFEFLQPTYNLKLGDKTLQELSPGERGALLLIFYLILDNDDIPLIIDQPEENLDNESVYHILVHFIKRVKENRQIIIVTHNPNLAVVCDADQIVHMTIEKNNKNTVKFYSGAIEDDVMNRKIINILEGTLPAFNNRDSKYIRL